MTIDNIKIGVIIPTRGERQVFLKNCMRMLKAQTLQPAGILTVGENYMQAIDDVKDITKRYRFGYDLTCQQFKYDLIAFIEDDDFYHPLYLENMATEWLRSGKPDILGTGSTIYYHLKLKKYFTFNHPKRASAMNTFIKPGLNIKWCEDSYAFTDMHLWNMSDIAQLAIPETTRIPKNLWLRGHIFQPEKIISIGMKHGIGLCGGRNHIDRLQRYDKDDSDMQFLCDNCDEESFEFYSMLFK